jgi:DnaK suppressor protein
MTTQADDAAPQTEEPFSPDELQGIEAALALAAARLRTELQIVDHDLSEMVTASPAGSLHDTLDVAAQHAELIEDVVRAENALAILEQTEHVLQRLADGRYTSCESCGTEIGRARLVAFPRASLCMGCV